MTSTKKASPQPSPEFILKLAQSTASGRRILAKNSLKYLVSNYLDRDLWPCQASWNSQLRRMSKGGIVSQPGAGKTELVARFIPLDLILHGVGDIAPRDIRIGCVSAAHGLAVKNVSLLKADLESPKLVADYGAFKPTKGLWGNTAITVRRNARLKDPTYEAFGIGGAIIGSRFDVLILDDPLRDEQEARNPTIMEQRVETIEGTIKSRLEPWGVLWFLGNRKGARDLYQHLIERLSYTVIISPALIREPEHYQVTELDHFEVDEWGKDTRYRIEIGDGDQGEALCPECWPVPRLLRERAERGSIIFNREFQAEVVDDENALIKKAWLDQCKDTNLSYGVFNPADYIAIVQGADPALTMNRKDAERRDTDYTVIKTLGITPNYHFDLIGSVRRRGMSPQEIHDLYVGQARLFNPKLQFTETNSFGEIIHWKLKTETGIPVVPHHTGRNKYDPYEGYPSLSVLFENKQIRLPYKTDADKQQTDSLCAELYNPEEAKHDDQLSALWIAYFGARRHINVLEKLKTLKGSSDGSKPKSGVRMFG
jgi:hypothetical protein